MSWHALLRQARHLIPGVGVRACRRGLLTAVGLSAGLTACSSLTSVDAPDVVQPGQLENPAGALTLFAGAYGYFGLGYSSAAEQSGVLTDELVAPSPTATLALADRRVL